MRTVLKYLMLLAGFATALLAVYWFVQASLLPVADVAQQTVHVLYNLQGAVWAMASILAFGFLGLMGTSARRSVDSAERDPVVHRPVLLDPLVEPPGRTARSGGARERVEPRL